MAPLTRLLYVRGVAERLHRGGPKRGTYVSGLVEHVDEWAPEQERRRTSLRVSACEPARARARMARVR